MAFDIGSAVRATAPITEPGFLGRKKFTHANKGDLGRVLAIDGEWLTVAWQGSTSDCHASNVRPALIDGELSAKAG